jgi:hypothetical protein
VPAAQVHRIFHRFHQRCRQRRKEHDGDSHSASAGGDPDEE